jgi:hypothetical protein
MIREDAVIEGVAQHFLGTVGSDIAEATVVILSLVGANLILGRAPDDGLMPDLVPLPSAHIIC